MFAKFYFNDPDAPLPNKWGIGAIAIIEYEGKVLIDKRSDCDQWAFFGGQPELDEGIRDCLIREVYEETGLTVRQSRFIGLFCNPTRIAAYPDGNVRRGLVMVFKVEVENIANLKISDESSDYRWVSRQELAECVLISNHLPIQEFYLALGDEDGEKWLIE